MSRPLPSLPGRVVVDGLNDLLDQLAAVLMRATIEAVEARGCFHLALSGGSTPEPLYRRLVLDPRFRLLPWEKTHVWQVDERQVPPDDVRRNWRAIREWLLEHVPTHPGWLHPMPVLAADPAAAYQMELAQVFAQGVPASADPAASSVGSIPRMDLVVLGLGADGHTASLFPGSPALAERDRWVAVNDGPTVTPPARLTLTYPLLNAARRTEVLVTGAGKGPVVARIARTLAARGPQPAELPITGVIPVDGELTWWLDDAAAGTADLPAGPAEAP